MVAGILVAGISWTWSVFGKPTLQVREVAYKSAYTLLQFLDYLISVGLKLRARRSSRISWKSCFDVELVWISTTTRCVHLRCFYAYAVDFCFLQTGAICQTMTGL